MNNSKKKRISMLIASVAAMFVLTVCVVSNTTSKSKADSTDQDSYEQYLPTIEQLAKDCGIYLANQQCPNVDISVEKTTPLYNVTNDIVGYSVSFTSNGVNYGYANFDFTTDELVADFAIAENADNLYDELSQDFANANADVDINDCTDKLYITNGIDYAVSAEADGQEYFFYGAETYTSDDFNKVLDHYEEFYLDYYDNTEYEDCFYYGIPQDGEDFIVDGKIADWFKKWIRKLFPGFFKDEEITPTAYPNHSEVLKKASKVLGTLGQDTMLPQYSREKSLVSQKTIMTTTKRYACGLVALTAICNQEDIMVNNNIQDTFNTLWDVTDTQGNIYDTISNYGIDGIECSGTSTYMMGQGMSIYGSKIGVPIKYGFQHTPSFEFYKDCVDSALPSVLCYQIKDEGGHGVSILGYTTSTINDQSFDFIIAADGWYDDAPRYVMYSPALFESTSGIVYQIMK